MGEKTAISWCDSTHNPWWGCTKVSPGCAHCYAEAMAERFAPDLWDTGRPRRRMSASTRRLPLTWSRRAARDQTTPRVFCGSMCDWLDPEVPVAWLVEVLDTIWSTPHLRWLLLTKRPELWRERLDAALADYPGSVARAWLAGRPPREVWVGASVEDQRRVEERIPALLAIPAAGRFLSVEPLLERVDLDDLAGIDWTVVGGESGPRARPCDVEWIRGVRDQCRAAGVPCFVRQLGTRAYDLGGDHLCADGSPPVGSYLDLRDSHGADWSEWPEDLRVREDRR